VVAVSFSSFSQIKSSSSTPVMQRIRRAHIEKG
jgi:hypothetical protein